MSCYWLVRDDKKTTKVLCLIMGMNPEGRFSEFIIRDFGSLYVAVAYVFVSIILYLLNVHGIITGIHGFLSGI
jgi:hypothetical protein